MYPGPTAKTCFIPSTDEFVLLIPIKSFTENKLLAELKLILRLDNSWKDLTEETTRVNL